MPKRRHYNPFLLHVMTLLWNGHTETEIAALLGRTQSTISNMIATPEAKEIYDVLLAQTIDTGRQVQTVLQAAAPAIIKEKVDLALNAKSETVRNQAGQQILEMAGHSAVRHLEIHRPDEIAENYKDKSEDDIRKEILRGLEENENDSPTSPPTFH